MLETFWRLVYKWGPVRETRAVMVSRARSWVRGMVGPLGSRKSEGGPDSPNAILFLRRLGC